MCFIIRFFNCFNTQPPEGGWTYLESIIDGSLGFNTQPPEGGWSVLYDYYSSAKNVSTHSRPKAAGLCAEIRTATKWEFQHTAARRRLALPVTVSATAGMVSTHSRPKAAGSPLFFYMRFRMFQHTAARRRLGVRNLIACVDVQFQHTAARRRLVRPDLFL